MAMHSGLCSLKQRKPNTIYSSIVFNEKNINNVKLLSSEGCIAFFTDWVLSRFYEKRVCSINTAELCCGFFFNKRTVIVCVLWARTIYIVLRLFKCYTFYIIWTFVVQVLLKHVHTYKSKRNQVCDDVYIYTTYILCVIHIHRMYVKQEPLLFAIFNCIF